MLKDKNVLVTGAAGFIGSNLVDALLADGACISGLDNMFNGRMEYLRAASASPRFTFAKGDVRDKDFLLGAMKGALALPEIRHARPLPPVIPPFLSKDYIIQRWFYCGDRHRFRPSDAPP